MKTKQRFIYLSTFFSAFISSAALSQHGAIKDFRQLMQSFSAATGVPASVLNIRNYYINIEKSLPVEGKELEYFTDSKAIDGIRNQMYLDKAPEGLLRALQDR